VETTMIPTEVRVGLHTVRLEPPDLVVITLVGDIRVEDVHGLIAEMHDFGQKHPKPFLIVDATRLGRFPPAARKAGMGLDERGHGRVFAVVGADFHQRVVLTLMVKALTLIRRVPVPPSAFFDTEAEARAWIRSLSL
jgi:SpoIIAA-like